MVVFSSGTMEFGRKWTTRQQERKFLIIFVHFEAKGGRASHNQQKAALLRNVVNHLHDVDYNPVFPEQRHPFEQDFENTSDVLPPSQRVRELEQERKTNT
mmetsp:Transcript_11493/g.17562  ORF Transcript_11493/g.17562 Transcript_11493/m.17562 type:complete len:100 (-) Transcript_11493:111-410(-)